ncbi:MAG: Stealth CR1 domain-containing protein [Lachnospiraceae bacterium]|nr:Stealth CR1 domain-containing protein [Lachnospiraceae bacterium]
MRSYNQKEMDIDIIITWVDGNDPAWQSEKEKYRSETAGADVRKVRYRDWDNLQYLFRSIERYAPWVHKVFLVTCGHAPVWLNIAHPKLKLIKHEDYLPKEWLPTFSSRTIDMNFHRIDALSEHFVYFNDDTFITGMTKEEDFFHDGIPCDTGIMKMWPDLSSINGRITWLAPLIDVIIVNQHFSKKDSVRKNWKKWANYRYGALLLSNLYLAPTGRFTGFRDSHLPVSYLKSTYKKVWEAEGPLLSETCSHRFRQPTDPNHWLFTYWQLASGNFYPRSPGIGLHCPVNKDTIDDTIAELMKNKYKMMCFNDETEEEHFEAVRDKLNNALKNMFPQKSSYEL